MDACCLRLMARPGILSPAILLAAALVMHVDRLLISTGTCINHHCVFYY
jgi:hypothetical protein